MNETPTSMWLRALEAASNALEASRRAGTLAASDMAPLHGRIQDQRVWLQGIDRRAA